jgi:2-polyprenyl-3-methyl-5-hydroxy-6-metoxy-1,4-benzoquinol methylase
MRPFYTVRSVPASSCILIPTREEALGYPTGDISLGFCPSCGFIANLDFNPGLVEYTDRYEGTQSFSPTFTAFHAELARRLIDRYGLRGKDIVEIGCGQGEFLSLICEIGGNRGVGYDPGYRGAESVPGSGNRVNFVKDDFSEKHKGTRADFVCCKMTLEHISKPLAFIRMLRRSLDGNPGAAVFFQVPDVSRILESWAFEDVYYEHCSYFAPVSLARLFVKNGFDVLHVGTEYDGQYLTIEAKVSGSHNEATPLSGDDIRALERLVDAFPEGVEKRIASWKRTIGDLVGMGKRVVLWGSGSKASAFTIRPGLSRELRFVVDINPRKHGYYMAGTGQRIVPPEFLQSYRPDAVIVMNGVYREEIRKDLAGIAVAAELLALR